MRAGGCTVQQALTPEAATVVKQAVSLARRRGHAQVTPLHVASTMLSSSAGLLRAACLRSHSHPLQCKALELCFNVALNRLPASTSSASMLGPTTHHHHHHPPSLSNALVAAFKRAQAHQRRGSIESQQQPLLAVKIELEQLVISILDDPSVSRVMREAGFSSTQVKNNVEQAVSSEICTPAPKEAGQVSKSRPSDQARSEDVMSVVDSLASRRRRSILVVGESLATTEGVVRGVMERVEKGEVPQVLMNLRFITLPLFTFRLMSREEVEHKVGELRWHVRSCCVVLYLGDLKWAAEYRASCGGRGGYCPVEHVVMEIRRLVGGGRGGDEGRCWVMGIGTYQTYMRCRAGSPSLEALWGLQPLAVPAGSLELSLNSGSQSWFKSKRVGDERDWPFGEDGAGNQLNCCADCLAKFETEARGLPNVSSGSRGGGSITSSLPSWLQQYKEESKRATTSDNQDSIHHLCKKWNSICHSAHKVHQHHPPEMSLHFYSASPSSSSISSYNPPYPSLRQWREHQFWPSETIRESFEPDSRVYLHEHDGQRPPPNPCTNPSSNPNSSSSSDTMDMEPPNRFRELNAENLKNLCDALERKVPWQGDIIPEIASTILQVRSGMVRRRERSRLSRDKEETWLFFLGGDSDGKEKIARELARLVFGSHTSFLSIGLSAFSSTKSDSTDDLRSKRSRSEVSHSYLERFATAIGENPHRVIMMEDIEQVDSCSQMGIMAAMERGRVGRSDGEELSLCDAIVILCCDRFDSRSRACSPPSKEKSGSEEGKDEEGEKEISSWVCLDLNLSAEDEEMEDCSIDDAGLLESVDRAFFFKLPECL